MRGLIARGTVMVVDEPRSFQGRDGQTRHSLDVYLVGDPRYAPDRISLDPSVPGMVPEVGEQVEYVVTTRARMKRDGTDAYETVWATARVTVEAPAV